jgi:hypothetical protein
VPTPYTKKTAACLAARVDSDSVKLDVGLLAAKTILDALSENGYRELLEDLSKYPRPSNANPLDKSRNFLKIASHISPAGMAFKRNTDSALQIG